MESLNLRVSIAPIEAAGVVSTQIENGSFSGELIDRYENSNEDVTLIVLVFEKYYMRNSSRASLTVTIENANTYTNVHAVGSGGGQGAIFKFDWGASRSFTDEVSKALSEYIV